MKEIIERKLKILQNNYFAENPDGSKKYRSTPKNPD